MTRTPAASSPQHHGSPAAELPPRLVVPVLALALGSFAIGTTEFTIMGLLPQAVEDLGVDLPAGGVLISAYALGVVVGAPLLSALLARTNRKTSSMLLMGLFTLGHIGSLFAPDYTTMLVARFLSGLPHGAYFSAAALAAAHLAGPTRRGQAISWVLSGLSVATLLGVPAATWLGQVTDWRSMFIVTAVLGVLTVAAIGWAVPSIPAPAAASIRSEIGGMASPELWRAVVVAVVGFSGIFALYTYISAITVQVGGMSPQLIPLALAAYGVGGVIGTLLGGRLADTSPVRAVQGMLLVLAVSLALFTLTAPWWALSLLFLFCIGIAGGSLSPAFQVLLVDAAPASPQLAGSLNHSAFNLANAVGAWVGAGVISAGGGLQLPSAAGAGLAAVGMLLSLVLIRPAPARPVN